MVTGKRNRMAPFSTRRMIAVTLGCAMLMSSPASAQPKIETVAGIAPIAWAVNQVGGDSVAVSVLLPTGASPETYAPAPQNLVRLSDARVLFTVGVPFEKRLTERVSDFARGLTITDVTDGIGLRRFDDDDSGQGLADPHVWLDPTLMYTIVENIATRLTAIDPGDSDYYRSRADSAIAKLHALDTELKSMLAPFKGRSMFVYHPSFGYFANRYGLHQVAIERHGKEASAKELTELISLAKADKVRLLFSQPQFSRGQAEVVAKEIGAEIAIVDPLSGDYFSMMRDLAMKVAQSYRNEAVRR
jgi:zinc transport system substrate-binding protein